MTQKAMICKSLLRGEVLSIMTAFKWFSVTNLPREISRQIENCFEVEVSRVKKDFVSKYGQSGYYYEYRLNRVPRNEPGILLMEQYVSEIENKPFKPPVKRGPKVKNIPKADPYKSIELEFDTTTGSWDTPIN